MKVFDATISYIGATLGVWDGGKTILTDVNLNNNSALYGEFSYII